MALERAAFPTDAWSEAMMAAELASPHARYLVDDEDGRVRGYGGVRAVAGAADADIQTIALDPAVRGSGRGRALLRELIAWARRRGAREVFLEVRADNPIAQRLYLSEGFAEIARRPRYYQPDDVDAIVMQLTSADAAPGAVPSAAPTGADPAGIAPAGIVSKTPAPAPEEVRP